MYLPKQAFTVFKRVLPISFAILEAKSQIGRQAFITVNNCFTNVVNSD